MEKLNQLISLCKCLVSIEVNDHRNCYESVADYISRYESPEIDDAVLQVMVEHDTVVSLMFYPDTPVGSYWIFHYDIDMAIDEALSILKERQK
ncbi:MAG: hypothetical protein LCH81_03710 [Bacteroidetes bacterium]|nr:hypothetical protein [Bacteroidota bacterium]